MLPAKAKTRVAAGSVGKRPSAAPTRAAKTAPAKTRVGAP